jgi:hypothetical protein
LREITYRLIDGSRAVTESNDIYDLDKGHTPENPRLTRVKLSHKRDPYFWDLIRNSRLTEVLNDLLGPDTNLLTSKLNTKAPGGGRAVEWHQDWAFYSATNDSLLAFGLMLEDVDASNGPLMVIPGTPHLVPRVADVPIRMPLPPAPDTGSIFKTQEIAGAKSAFSM